MGLMNGLSEEEARELAEVGCDLTSLLGDLAGCSWRRHYSSCSCHSLLLYYVGINAPQRADAVVNISLCIISS